MDRLFDVATDHPLGMLAVGIVLLLVLAYKLIAGGPEAGLVKTPSLLAECAIPQGVSL
jgi:hypothetical protein